MQMSYSDFDTQFRVFFAPLWRFCFLTTGDKAAAQDLTFRAFLCLGAAKDEEAEKLGARRILFSAAVTLVEDYYLKKMRRMPKRERLMEAELPFELTDGVWNFLCLPLERRFVLLLSDVGCSEAESAAIMRKSERFVRAQLDKAPQGDWRTEISVVLPADGADDVMNDKIYMRFAERSVAVENKIHGIRYAFNRAAPWLAAGILLIFAFAYWYVDHI